VTYLSLSRLTGVLCGFALFALPGAFAGSIYVSGEDPDFHSQAGPNAVGAQHIIEDSLIFARNGNTAPILLLESNLSNLGLGDHLDSETGLIFSGYPAASTPGNHYVKVDAATFSALTLVQI
jgi:hypothetical protein